MKFEDTHREENQFLPSVVAKLVCMSSPHGRQNWCIWLLHTKVFPQSRWRARRWPCLMSRVRQYQEHLLLTRKKRRKKNHVSLCNDQCPSSCKCKAFMTKLQRWIFFSRRLYCVRSFKLCVMQSLIDLHRVLCFCTVFNTFDLNARSQGRRKSRVRHF